MIKYIDFDFIVGADGTQLIDTKKGFLNKYFYYNLLAKKIPNTGYNRHFKYLKDSVYLFPPLPEQKQIVKILETWDKYLEKLSRKIEIKKDIKKGIASQIMNCELLIVNGKKVYAPKVRLDGFSGEWESVRLGKIAEIKKGEQLNREYLTEDGEFPSYSGGITPSGYTNKYNVEKNKIIISEGGNSCGYINFIKENFWAGGHCYVVLEKKVEKDFLFQFLKISEIKIMRLRVGSGLPNVQKKDIENFKINIPNKDEQTAIAKILTTADKEIEALEKKKKIIEDQKKYLLNNLVTGKIRVNC